MALLVSVSVNQWNILLRFSSTEVLNVSILVKHDHGSCHRSCFCFAKQELDESQAELQRCAGAARGENVPVKNDSLLGGTARNT